MVSNNCLSWTLAIPRGITIELPSYGGCGGEGMGYGPLISSLTQTKWTHHTGLVWGPCSTNPYTAQVYLLLQKTKFVQY